MLEMWSPSLMIVVSQLAECNERMSKIGQDLIKLQKNSKAALLEYAPCIEER